MEKEPIVVEVSSLKTSEVQIGIQQLQKKIDAKPKMWVSNILLHRPIVKEDRPYLEIEYYLLNEEEIKNREDYLEAARRKIVSMENTPVEAIEGIVTLLKIQNPLIPVERQDDIRSLLGLIADVLNKYSDSQVSDLVYHDYINDDSLHHPYVHLYISKV